MTAEHTASTLLRTRRRVRFVLPRKGGAGGVRPLRLHSRWRAKAETETDATRPDRGLRAHGAEGASGTHGTDPETDSWSVSLHTGADPGLRDVQLSSEVRCQTTSHEFSLPLCLPLSVSVSLCLYLPPSPSLSLSLSLLPLCLCLPFSVFVSLSLSLSPSLSLSLSRSLSPLSVSLPFPLSLSVSSPLSVPLCLCLSSLSVSLCCVTEV